MFLYIFFLQYINKNLIEDSISKIITNSKLLNLIFFELSKTDFTKEVYYLQIFANTTVPILRRRCTTEQFNEDKENEIYCTVNDFITYCMLTD